MTTTRPPDMHIMTVARVVAYRSEGGVHEEGNLGTCQLDIRYWTSDPHAVHFTFSEPDQIHEPITWTFARQLLRDGMDSRAGEGLVEVFAVYGLLPSLGQVGIRFRSDHDWQVVEVPRDMVRTAVIRMYDLVPAGEEPLAVDWDATFRQLLGGAR